MSFGFSPSTVHPRELLNDKMKLLPCSEDAFESSGEGLGHWLLLHLLGNLLDSLECEISVVGDWIRRRINCSSLSFDHVESHWALWWGGQKWLEGLRFQLLCSGSSIAPCIWFPSSLTTLWWYHLRPFWHWDREVLIWVRELRLGLLLLRTL